MGELRRTEPEPERERAAERRPHGRVGRRDPDQQGGEEEVGTASQQGPPALVWL